jgi:cysteine desulfurase/selenocysteine lyase
MVERLFEALEQYRYSTKLVAITGASNVTGYMPPLKEIARAVHAYGGYLLVDGAQLVPHCRVDVGTREDPECIDFLAFSGHKMYAPYGAGALVGPREFFEEGIPEEQGGGAVELVSREFVLWKTPPAKEEVGSPNALGIVAMAVAAKVLMELGMDCVSDYEKEIARYALRQLKKVPGLQMHGITDFDTKQDRIGVFAFQMKNIHHNLIAAILSYEFGIATRSDSFCAHPYVFQLLGVQPQVVRKLEQEIQQEKRANFPGLVRASIGIYNTFEDIDAFVDALQRIVKGRYQGNYAQDSTTGDFVPLNAPAEFHYHFHL